MAPAEESIASLESLYKTSGGYTHNQVDTAGIVLIDMLQADVKELWELSNQKHVEFRASMIMDGQSALNKKLYRAKVEGSYQKLQIRLSSAKPVVAVIDSYFELALPKDLEKKGELKLFEGPHNIFSARMDQLYPNIKSELRIRIKLFAEQVFNQKMAQLAAQAQQAMNR